MWEKTERKWCVYIHKNKINNKKTAGKHPVTREPLSWQYADDINSGETQWMLQN